LLALAIFAATIASLEGLYRRLGFQPDVPDSVELWAYQRSRVVGGDPNLIVAIGTSRIRTGLDPQTIAKCLPQSHFVQLGVDGPASAVGVLEQLSHVPNFCGIVVCDIPPLLLHRERWEDQASFYAPRIPKVRIWNTALYSLLCEYFVTLSPRFSLQGRLAAMNDGARRTGQSYCRVHSDRSSSLKPLSPDELIEIRDRKEREQAQIYDSAKRYASDLDFQDNVAPIKSIVARIRRSEGRIVFLRLPVSSRRLVLEESAISSKKYLTMLADLTRAPCIDFRDLPQPERIDCPDDSHLSPSGARAFTTSLIERMQANGILTDKGAT
jgi:hypothetical protein